MALQGWRQREDELQSQINDLKIAFGGGGNRPGEDAPYRPPDPKEVPGVPPGYPNIPKLLAHVNEDGTAHDWRAPDHGGIPVPGGEVNPHGRRGTNTWPSGRQKYTPEELKQIEDYMRQDLERIKSMQISRSRTDKLIPMVMEKYGKRDGMYQDKDKLLRNLLTIGESIRA